MDAQLDTDPPCVHVRRAIVNGQLTAPKSRHGRRTIPISRELADRLRELAAGRGETELSRSSSMTTLCASPIERRSIMTLPVMSRPAPPCAQRR